MVGPSGESARCRSCSHDLRVGARFCDACGTPVAPPPRAEGERKTITVLIADVVGSMQLAVRLDAERLRTIMHELLNRAGAVVQRYQGTVDKFTGDGLMALFGAPRALEDHALRACIAALEIQSETKRFAAEVLARDGVALRLRVGLNSGEVIAGEIGVGPGSYTAIGHPVGLAQRMEAAAAPGTVLCSMSTARLVEESAELGPVLEVTAKGSTEPVSARTLVGIRSGQIIVGRSEGAMLGRDAHLQRLRTIFGERRGSLAGIVGGPGLGKSRLLREFCRIAADEGARVVLARCEAHTAGVAFHAASRLLRALFDVAALDDADARRHILATCPHLCADATDAQILFDAMGIADPQAPPIPIGVDGRRRRLVHVMTRAVQTQPTRVVLVLEDLHWIDDPSDQLLTEFAAPFAETQSLLVTTYRPEFHGALDLHMHHKLVLDPLPRSTSLELLGHILGSDASLAGVAEKIADAAAGYPLFIEEMVRDLAGRDVLSGSRGRYRLISHIDTITVPATVQAVLAARIDRLSDAAKAVLNSAAVIGTRFEVNTLRALRPDTRPEELAELVSAELIDQTEFAPRQRYCFRHPLVRTVAYDSQLSTTRRRAHRRLAAALEARDPYAADDNAAMIATHLEAAGELADAYRWYMRAADWLRPRDLPAARAAWESALRCADQSPTGTGDVIGMRLAPRTMLMSTLLYTGESPDTDIRYREFHELATAAGDFQSLALGTAGRLFSLIVNDFRLADAAALIPHLDALTKDVAIEPDLRAIVLNSLAYAQFAHGDFGAALRAVDAILDLSPPAPLAETVPAQALRGVLQACLGRAAVAHRDIEEGMHQTRLLPPVNAASIQVYWAVLLTLGLYEAARLIDATRDVLGRAEEFGDACGIVIAQWVHGTVLLRAGGQHREEGLTVLRKAHADCLKHRVGLVGLTTIDSDLAMETARRGALDEAIGQLRTLLTRCGGCAVVFAVVAREALVELLAERGRADDLTEAHLILDQWQRHRPEAPALDLWWLRSRALLARAEGRAAAYAESAGQYLESCERLDARGRLSEARLLAGESRLQAGMA
ncbi:ATP-binding protein [Mycolicibacterium phlei]